MHVCRPVGKGFSLGDAVVSKTSDWDLPSGIIEVGQLPLLKDIVLDSACLHGGESLVRFTNLVFLHQQATLPVT